MNVILYTRVSTDEQADGLGREAQERYLRAYCVNHNYNIVGDEQPYKEDYSAKSHELNRPELTKVYKYCKKHRGQVNKVLFLRWDRFTRNVEFAYTYKRKFYDEMGIEINAIEAPIDFTRPDWALMLAMYCGAAHAEDNKIAERTKDGNHEHLMRGEWVSKAPRGYRNVRAGKHDCWIEIDKTKAPAIKKAFEEVAKGLETPTRIKKRLCPYIPDSSFFDMLRNPFYAGIIRVPAYKDDPEQFVQGKHEPLIDKRTFDKVQGIINGKDKKVMNRKLAQKQVNPDLYLRRFLICPVCGHPLTGATTTGGHGGKYTYYFCNYDHKHINTRAEEVNEGFVKYVAGLKPNKAVLELYNEILSDIRDGKVKEHLGSVSEFLEKRKIESLNELERHFRKEEPAASAPEKKAVAQQEYQSKKSVSREERRLRNRMSFLEKTIAETEARMKDIEKILAAPGADDDIMELTRQYLELKRDLDAKTDEWVATGAELDKAD